MNIALNIATDDDATADLVVEALERFAEDSLSDILLTADPLTTVNVAASDGYLRWF